MTSANHIDGREWGPWSVWKTELVLGGYLSLFLRVGSSSVHRTFIDCFAGSVENRERGTGRAIDSSTTLAFRAQPEFTHLVLFELDGKAAQLDTALRSQYPDRRFAVIAGDVNVKIREGLRWLRNQGDSFRGPHKGQAIAYLDPDNHGQLAWDTIKDIAGFCREGGFLNEPLRERPVELLILLPTGTMRRELPVAHGTSFASTAAVNKVTRLFGTQDWLHIYNDQRRGVIFGDESWQWYVDLFRYRLKELGYDHVSAIEIRNTKNAMLYHLVFASGHTAGRALMNHVMEHASRVLPQKLQEERKAKALANQPSLFDGLEEELEAVAASPQSYAVMFRDAPKKYESGMGGVVNVERPEPPKRKDPKPATLGEQLSLLDM